MPVRWLVLIALIAGCGGAPVDKSAELQTQLAAVQERCDEISAKLAWHEAHREATGWAESRRKEEESEIAQQQIAAAEPKSDPQQEDTYTRIARLAVGRLDSGEQKRLASLLDATDRHAGWVGGMDRLTSGYLSPITDLAEIANYAKGQSDRAAWVIKNLGLPSALRLASGQRQYPDDFNAAILAFQAGRANGQHGRLLELEAGRSDYLDAFFLEQSKANPELVQKIRDELIRADGELAKMEKAARE